MPWHVAKSNECPESKPWAVIKDSDGSVAGCHVSKSSAQSQVAALYAQEGNKMQHLLVKATITDTDTEQGTFRAVISTASIDREGDIVEPAAVVTALQKWIPTGKKVPLSWNHSVKSEDIFGHIEPGSAVVNGAEVEVDGWMDRETPRGKDAWRLVKSGTLGFSYGYLMTKAADREGGGKHITELDIFEITATPIPANGDTRVIGYKSVDTLTSELEAVTKRLEVLERTVAEFEGAEGMAQGTKSRAMDPLRSRAMDVALDVMSDGVSAEPPVKQEPVRTKGLADDAEALKKHARDLMITALSGG